jgi:hypothetical protein
MVDRDEPDLIVYNSGSRHKTDDEGGDVFIPGRFKVTGYDVGKAEFTLSGQTTISKIVTPIASMPGLTQTDTWKGPIAGLCISMGHAPSPPTIPVNTRELCLQKARSKVGQAAVNMDVELGELRETAQMLRDPFRGLRDFFFKKNKRNLTNWGACVRFGRGLPSGTPPGKVPLDIADTMANTWLELRYGLRPLISSIEDIAEEVQKKKQAFYPERMKSTLSQWYDSIGLNTTFESGCCASDIRVTARLNGFASTRVRAKVYYLQSRGSTTAEQYGLALQNLPELAWELTRGSFLVDWVYSVGPWLGSCRIQPHITILGNTVSEREEVQCYGTLSNYRSTRSDTKLIVSGENSAYTQKSEYTRSVAQPIPSTPIYRGNAAITLAKELDMLALTLQPVLKGLRNELFKR